MGRRWFKIGAGSAAAVGTVVTLLLFLASHYGFEISGTDDVCAGTLEDPCISYISIRNPTGDYVDVFNQNQIQLEFSQSVKEYYLFRKDGRCKGGDSCAAPNGVSLPGWNFIDFTNETKPLKDKVYVYRFPAYTTKDFLLWGLKYDPTHRVKWTINVDLEGLRNGELDPVWDGVGEMEPGEYSLIKSCKDVTRERTVKKSREVWSNKNVTFETEDYYEKEEYLVEVCEEIGAKTGDKEILYKQKEVNCLRTDNIVCCWDYNDAGTNIEGRKGKARIDILSGEKGECRDLDDNLKVIMNRGNVGVSIDEIK